MKPQIRSAALQGYREAALALGLDPVAMMRAEGLDPTCLNDPDRRVPAEALFQLFEHTAQAANAPDLGLRLAAARPFSIMGPLSLAARDEPTARDAFQVLIRYLHLHNEGIQVRVSEQDGMAAVEIASNLGKPLPVPVSIESAAGMAAKMLKAFLGESWSPVRMQFEHGAPADLRPYRQLFGCPVKFGQDRTSLHLHSADLDRPNQMSNGGLTPYARKYLKELAERADATLADRVRQLIRLELSSGRCTARRVAQSLGLNRRTLHRQLAALQTTYTDLSAAVREELAQRHVCHSQRPLHEVADMLGFSELSAFSRWYKTRFGASPSAARRGAEPPQLH